jgi:hypothetical protein
MAMTWQGFPPEALKSIQVPVLIAAGDPGHCAAPESMTEFAQLTPAPCRSCES